jgi:starch phosphorylase
LIGRKLPAPLSPLNELALDLRWTWSHGADELWRSLDAKVWEATRNPWFVLMEAPAKRLAALAEDSGFVAHLGRLVEERRLYRRAPSWWANRAPGLEKETVAYFSMEFGLGEAVPLYAGGLGILAGDYLKAASDLGAPVVGVGILYREGYFRQILDQRGWQQEAYPYNDPTTLPIQPLADADGGWVRVPLDLAGRTLWLRAWLARVGRVDLYLLDSNDPLNLPLDRGITAKLYGGGPEMRLLQEIVLGVGGWRLLETLGVRPTIAHLNEGHAAFAVLERARSFAREAGVSFAEALVATRAGNVFTTHTPVAAGFNRFDPPEIERNLLASGAFLSGAGLSARELLALGRTNADDQSEPFNMAYLATRGCAFVNGVSRLHGEVSRGIFAPLFPRWPIDEVPITHVTNGVHVPSWDSPAADDLWTLACGKDRWRDGVESLEPIVAALDDEQLWSLRTRQRRALVSSARERLARQLARAGVVAGGESAAARLDPEALTLGFARRFAEYKRPHLLLTDPDRLARILTNRDRPAQLVVAGKAHPADEGGKRLIEAWVEFARRPDVRERVVFLEDYDIALAEELTQGVDVWVNTPRRPMEACGTSGMKVLVNGGLNLSERDGWWAEADDADVGWGLGGADDGAEARLLYETLEQRIIPEFYERDPHGIPRRWLGRIRASMSRLAPRFSANRMLREYLDDLYVPAAMAVRRRTKDGARIARELTAVRARLQAGWGDVVLETVEVSRDGNAWRFRVAATLGAVPVEAVRCHICADPVNDAQAVREPLTPAGRDERGRLRFEGRVASARSASDFTPRLVAWHADAFCPSDLPFIRWPQ